MAVIFLCQNDRAAFDIGAIYHCVRRGTPCV